MRVQKRDWLELADLHGRTKAECLGPWSYSDVLVQKGHRG